MSEPPAARAATYLTRPQEYALAAAIAVVIANAYYIHPIVAEVAEAFGVSQARIGLVPALNQVALALGILLLLPLGDHLPNRTLCIVFVCLQTVAMLGMALADAFALFTLASTVLGFVTIAPYLLPAFASKRVAPERLGHVTALLTAGVIFGILVARVGAGVIAEAYGWRSVYWAAVVLMGITSALLPLAMRSEQPAKKVGSASYPALIASVFTLARQHRETLMSALIQALNFAAFIATWLALALHLTSPALGYGTDTVGWLAAVSAISIFSTPRLGRWADEVGPRRARLVMALVQLGGVALLYPLGFNAWALVVPLVIIAAVGPGVDVTGRMTFLALNPAIRTRLTTIYIVIMFTGGGLGSIAGTAIYDYGGWAATCALMAALSLTILLLAWWASKQWRPREDSNLRHLD